MSGVVAGVRGWEMNLMLLMRRFSIRLRMVGAIGVVLLLLCGVGVAGLWGLFHMQRLHGQLVQHSVAEMAVQSRLLAGLGALRRHERDMLLQHTDPAQVQATQGRWQAVLRTVQTQLQAVQAGAADADNAIVAEVERQLQRYAQAVAPVAQQLASGGYATLSDANALLATAHQAFEQIDAQMLRLEETLAQEVALAEQEAQAAGQRLLVFFAVLVGLAVVVVVPTTVANMQSICRPLQEAEAVAVAIARGDLSTRVAVQGSDEISDLMRSLFDMQASIARIVGEVRQVSDHIRSSSAEVAGGNQDLSQRTEQANHSLEATAASIQQLTGNVQRAVDKAREASDMAAANAAVAQRGGEVVGQVVATMDAINQSSRKIHDIIGVIDGIAFQTNILALNAAVEAARAGEQGRGFAVVAGGVGSLAQRSAEAAREIKGLVGHSVGQVESGAGLVHQAGLTIGDIVDKAQQVAALIDDITATTTAQSGSITEVNVAVGQLDQATQQNAALVQAGTAASESLRAQAQRLGETVAVFRLASDVGEHPPLPPAATRRHRSGGTGYHGSERRQRSS